MRTVSRKGLALPLLLLLLVALSAFGHGMLLLSRRELQAVWAFGHSARAKAAAQIGLQLAWQAPPDSSGSRLPLTEQILVEGQTEDGLYFRGIRRWLDSEFFLLEGVGGSRGWAGEYRLGWIGWTMMPLRRIQAFLAPLEVGGSAEGLADPDPGGLELHTLPEDWPPGACRTFQPLLDSSSTDWGKAGFARREAGEEPHLRPGSSIPGLGLLSGPALLELSTEPPSFGGGPGQDASYGCPGSAPPVLAGTPGHLRMTRGRVCGLLLVGGDLELGGDATFQGLALVGGNLSLQEGATFEGMARVGNRFFQRDEASFRASLCPVLRALYQIPSLTHPVPLGPSMRME